MRNPEDRVCAGSSLTSTRICRHGSVHFPVSDNRNSDHLWSLLDFAGSRIFSLNETTSGACVLAPCRWYELSVFPLIGIGSFAFYPTLRNLQDTECNMHGVLNEGHCQCDAGYPCVWMQVTHRWHGDTCTEQCPGYLTIDEGTFDCNGYGDCIHNQSTNKWECVCDEYASGEGCQNACPVENTDSGATIVCSNHGTCDSTAGTCDCNPGYYGDDCSLSCPGLRSATNETATECSGHGDCIDIGISKVECECNAGFYGEACDKQCPGLVEEDGVEYACSGHGECDNGVCRCDPFFYGEACDKQCPGLIEINGEQRECNGHGVCNGQTLKCECVSPSYEGDACAFSLSLSSRHLRRVYMSPRPLHRLPDLCMRRRVAISSP